MLRMHAVITLLPLLFSHTPLHARTPPATNCLDARQLSEMRQPDSRTLAVAATTGGYFRIDLRDDCPGLETQHNVMLMADEGWACGAPHESVRHEGGECAVAAVTAIDARSYAALARSADRNDIATLDTVQVKAQVQLGFRGSHSYCFNPREMRGWSEDPKGLTVQTAPRLNGGNSSYRVELSHTCTLLSRATQVRFVSGLGIGIICGHPGDRLAFGNESGRRNFRAECSIGAVYPTQ